MTHQRTIEAGAAHILRELHDRGLLKGVDDDLHEEIGEAVAQAAAMGFAAEGFVVVPREATSGVKSAIRKFVQERAIPSQSDDDPDGIYFDCGHARELYDAMITAAQQEQNDVSDL